jgi:hypothetical protein
MNPGPQPPASKGLFGKCCRIRLSRRADSSPGVYSRKKEINHSPQRTQRARGERGKRMQENRFLQEGAPQRLLALALVRLPSAFSAHSAVNPTLESDDNSSLDSFYRDFGIIGYLK